MEIYWLIAIGMTTGWFAGQLMGGKGFGLLGDLIAGATGALIGGSLFEKLGILPGSGLIGSLLLATSGAFICLYTMRMVKKV